MYLAPDALVLPIPDTLDPVVATLFNPIGAGIRWAVEIPETKAGDVVAVLGPGIRGLSAAAAAKHAGAEFVMVTGLGNRDEPRLAEARRFGADLTVDVTAKAATAPGQALNLVRPGGTVVLAGTRGSPEVPGFDPDLIVYKEIRVVGALGVAASNYVAALDLLESPLFPFADLPRQTAGFGDLEHLVRTMAGETDELAPVHAVFDPNG